MLLTRGSIEQLRVCRPPTVKEQLKFERLFRKSSEESANASTIATSPDTLVPPSHKLTLVQLKHLSPEDKHIYLMK